MSIDSIKNIQTNIVNNKNKTSFTSNSETKVEEKSNGKALLITGLAALSALGIYLVTRGKKGSDEIPPEVQKPVEQIKEMAMDAFKQAGNKIEKGVAKLANGENFTGKITRQLKDGNVLVDEYQDGLLQTITKMNDEGIISLKTFSYDKTSGKLLSVTSNNKKIFERVYASDGDLKYVYNKSFMKDYDNEIDSLREYSPDGKIKYQFKHVGSNNSLAVYDKDAKLETTIYTPLRHDMSEVVNTSAIGNRAKIMHFETAGKEYKWEITSLKPSNTDGALKDMYMNVVSVRVKGSPVLDIDTEASSFNITKRCDFNNGKSGRVLLSGEKGNDTVNILFQNEKVGVTYNTKTKKVENLPQDYPHTEEEVINFAEELLGDAHKVEKEIQSNKDYAAKYNELKEVLKA